MLIKQIVLPEVLYAAPAWATTNKTRLIQLRRKFSLFAKNVLGHNTRHATIELYNELKLNTIEEIVEQSTEKMLNRVRSNILEYHNLQQILDLYE